MAKFSVTGQLTVYNMNDVLASPTPPPKPTEGALWLNEKDNQLYVYIKGSWVISADYKNWVNSKGDNLVSNGGGSLGNNSNFSAFEFDGSDSYSGGGSFKDSGAASQKLSDELIPVDISKSYKLSLWAKTNPYVGAKYYVGVYEHDMDGLPIYAENHMYVQSTFSTLTQDLKPGDTVVYLDNVTNWLNTAPIHQRKLIFWDYVSKTGYKYQPLTYSRNVSVQDLWADGAINTTNKTITLRAPWNKALVKAGTKLSQGSSGSGFRYIAVQNAAIPGTWTNYSGVISGLNNSGNDAQNQFSWGTAYVKIGFLNNRDVTGSTVWYSNISFGLNVADQGQVDKIADSLESLGSDGKITRFERSLVRGYIADIVGKFLNYNEAMPTLAQIDNDNYNAGKLYSIRRMARKIGLNLSTSVNYKPLGDAYTALVTYLTSLTPVKPWDTTSSATINIDRNTWNAKWNEYYNRYALFEIEVQDRQKEYTDQVGEKMTKDTIAAISTTGNYARATFANPVNIKPPIATLGLPEFEGSHVDSWYVNGRNVLAGTGTPKTMVGENRDNQTSTIYTFIAGSSAPITGVGEFTVMFDWSVEGDAPAGTMYMQGSNPYPGLTSSITFSSSNRSGRYIGTNSIAGTVATFNGINMRCNFLVGKLTISNMKIAVGKHTANPVYTPAPEEAWAGAGNRFRPVTNPVFSSGTDLTIWGKFYGDGTNNDTFSWETNGNAVKTKKWMDVRLDDKMNWDMNVDYTGFKRLRAQGFAYSTPVSGGSICVKPNAGSLNYDGNVAGNNQFAINSPNNILYVTVSDSDSGWGESYTPTKEEINAYFLGWKMCNGTFGSNYTGTGVKVWHPIGDKDLSRATVSGNTAPTGESPSISDKSINYYQLIYRLQDPIQEIVEFDGILELLGDKDNVVTTYYPAWTPEISKGSIKYGTNLATVNQDTRYIIPSMVKRIANAEQKITDESITNTVFSSREYTLALKSKANASDLGNLASKDELNNVSGAVDGKIKDAMDKLDFSPYATKSELKQTATDITAKFSATGGMNLIKNSIGYSDRDFWSLTTAYLVDTISNSALDNLGFGRGFYFKANGQETGIYQDVSVIPGQPYTLGWYLNKMTKGADTSYRFWIQVQEYNGSVWVVPPGNQIADNSNQTTNGFEARYLTFTPTKDKVRIRFIGYANVEAIVSGIMLNIGDVALQWTLATGELYNTNIRMNINGIRVSQLDANGSEIGFTQITPSEFAGYYQNNGTFEKVFYLNGDETVTKKLRATSEITLGNIKILSIQSATATGWAFVPNNS
ncbi:putative tail fiber 1 [Bacillus phage BCU4]|uniref:Putative tail fiber 1 n=1 Tax=Bacillus phage BCU4 TaxID=1126951 RepID=J9PRE8_9CAUD|nr:putative tail fiber 1 [Bacillus phage BCU4]AEW47696.1 putative tail fiber 1 [Bacillus phage BCU4]